MGKESICDAGDTGDLGSITGLGRSPGEGHSNPLQYFCLENPMHRGPGWDTVRGVAESDTEHACTHSTVWLYNTLLMSICIVPSLWLL